MGFSYSEDPRDRVYDEVGVANDMLDFLNEFFKAHPKFAARDFYITGESYGGHYVPAVGHAVWEAVQQGKLDTTINLKGIAIGNGMTDPSIQYGAYPDFAVMHGLISESTKDHMLVALPACQAAISLCMGTDWSAECKLALAFCQATLFNPILMAADGINVYDIRKKCTGDLCYDFSGLEEYMNREDVQKKLGVEERNITWVTCNMDVNQDMLGDFVKNYDSLLPPMLKAGIRVMIYAGDQDLICNWVGNQRWMDALQWDGSEDWAQAAPHTWRVGGEAAGTVRAVGPLSFVKVFDSGHMVPMDKPENALDLITLFTRNEGPVADKGEQVTITSAAGGVAAVRRLLGQV